MISSLGSQECRLLRHIAGKPPIVMKKMGVVRVTRRQCGTEDTVEDDHGQAQRAVLPETKIRIITIVLRRVLSEIKLKRTDTTLDLSQKAKRAKEKGKKTEQKGGTEARYI